MREHRLHLARIALCRKEQPTISEYAAGQSSNMHIALTKRRVDQNGLTPRRIRHLLNVRELKLSLLRRVDGAEHVPLLLIAEHADDVLRALDLCGRYEKGQYRVPCELPLKHRSRTKDSGLER